MSALDPVTLRAELFRRAKGLAGIVGPHLPGFAGRVPYKAAFVALEAALVAGFGRGRLQIWSRNSYLTSSFIPGVSDLDVTILFHERPSAEDCRKLVRIIDKSRSFFPWLGEANVYIESELAGLAPLFNSLELDRDPELAARLPRATTLLSRRTEAAAFLARTLERDAEGLKLRPGARFAKWKFHLEDAGCPPPARESATQKGMLRYHAVESLFGLLGSEPSRRAGFRSAVRAHLDLAAMGQTADYSMGRNAFLYALYPNRYCGTLPPPTLSPELARVALAQLAWECFGLRSQQYWMSTDPSLIPHIRRMENVLTLLGRHSELASGVTMVRKSLSDLVNSLGLSAPLS